MHSLPEAKAAQTLYAENVSEMHIYIYPHHLEKARKGSTAAVYAKAYAAYLGRRQKQKLTVKLICI